MNLITDWHHKRKHYIILELTDKEYLRFVVEYSKTETPNNLAKISGGKQRIKQRDKKNKNSE